MKLSRFKILLFALSSLFANNSYTQSDIAPIERNNFKAVTSHKDLLEYLRNIDSLNEQLHLEIIGKSVQGRDIPLISYSVASNKQKIKVLLFCQQHGNEPSGKEAATLLINKLVEDKTNYNYSNLELYIIPSLNPDGNEAGKRQNANKEDLNRNHLILKEPEVLLLHNLFNKIMPEVTLDVHEYTAFRKSFLEAGYVRSTAEELGAPTNLNVSKKIIDYAHTNLFPYVNNKLASKGVTFSEYHKIGDPKDTVRASTTNINDGRQSFAILNTFSFLLEGQNGRSFNDELQRRSNEQLAAIEAFLSFVNENSSEISALVAEEREKIRSLKDSVIIQMDYNFIGEKINIPIQILPTMKDSISEMHYTSTVKAIKAVSRPEFYLIPKEETELINLLNEHGIIYNIIEKDVSKKVEIYKVKGTNKKHMENKTITLANVSKLSKNHICRTGDVLVPLSQIHGTMISIALEPESMWGIIQYEDFSHLLKVGEYFPIYRIMN